MTQKIWKTFLKLGQKIYFEKKAHFSIGKYLVLVTYKEKFGSNNAKMMVLRKSPETSKLALGNTYKPTSCATSLRARSSAARARQSPRYENKEKPSWEHTVPTGFYLLSRLARCYTTIR